MGLSPRLAPLLAVLLLGCPPAAPDEPAPPPPGPQYDLGEPTSVKSDLKMKRWRQVHLDLEGALELPPDLICNETGIYDCRILHSVQLGGISIDNGLFRPIDALSATTGLAVERFVMQACATRAALDATSSTPLIFSLAPDATTLERAEADALVSDLYRRFLARDPLPEELDAVFAMHAGIIEDGGLNLEWAWMACFAVGTTTEALLY
jgi:hypothetical protein